MLLRALSATMLLSPAAFACPTAVDLAKGIEISYTDLTVMAPFSRLFRQSEDGAILEIEDYGEGDTGITVSENGILQTACYTAFADDPEPRDTASFTYDFALPMPPASGNQASGTRTQTLGTGAVTPRPIRIEILETAPLAIGPCTYVTTRIATTIGEGDAEIRFTQGYSEGLAFAFPLAYGTGTDPDSVFVPVAIRALP